MDIRKMNENQKIIYIIVFLLIGSIFGIIAYHHICLYIEPKLISFPFKDIRVCEKKINAISRGGPYYQYYLIHFPRNIEEIWDSFTKQAKKYEWYERKKPFRTYWPFEKELYKDKNRKIFIRKDNKKIMACQILPDFTVICIIRSYDKKQWDHAEETMEYIRSQFKGGEG
jgi:hypothetical protein